MKLYAWFPYRGPYGFGVLAVMAESLRSARAAARRHIKKSEPDFAHDRLLKLIETKPKVYGAGEVIYGEWFE